MLRDIPTTRLFNTLSSRAGVFSEFFSYAKLNSVENRFFHMNVSRIQKVYASITDLGVKKKGRVSKLSKL